MCQKRLGIAKTKGDWFVDSFHIIGTQTRIPAYMVPNHEPLQS